LEIGAIKQTIKQRIEAKFDRTCTAQDHDCGRCGAKFASFGVGPPMNDALIWLCGGCYWMREGAHLIMDRLQEINGDE
jgi:hypothetical protein